MRYEKPRIKLPPDMVVGSEVGIAGESDATQFITAIERDEEGNVTEVHLSGGCREPLSKIYLFRHGASEERAALQMSYNDRTGWIDVSIGECDVCGRKFPDSYVFESDPNKPDSMICLDCNGMWAVLNSPDCSKERSSKEPKCPHCDYADPGLLDALSIEGVNHVGDWKCPNCDENYSVEIYPGQEDEKLSETESDSVKLTPINQERLSLLEDCLEFLKEVKHGPSCNTRCCVGVVNPSTLLFEFRLSSGKCDCQVPALISRLEARLKADKELIRA
jgi:hypothetical protein